MPSALWTASAPTTFNELPENPKSYLVGGRGKQEHVQNGITSDSVLPGAARGERRGVR